MKSKELSEKLEAGEDVLLLDVREPEEFAGADHLPGAINMPMDKVFLEDSAGNLPKDKKIITVCKSGGRCEVVAKELKAKGYDIDFLEGGMNDWAQSH